MVVLERLSSRRDGAVVIDSFYEAGVVERYPEVFEKSETKPTKRSLLDRLTRALRRATKEDSPEEPELRIADDGIGV